MPTKKSKKAEPPKGKIGSFFTKSTKKSTGMPSREHSNEKEVSSSSSSSTTPKHGATNEETAKKIADLVVKKIQQQGKKGHEVQKTKVFLKCKYLEAQFREI